MNEVKEAWDTKRKECEEALATVAATDPSVLVELSTMVSEDDFRNPFFGKWFSIACQLAESQMFDRGTLRGELMSRGFLESIGELADWANLSNQYVSAHSAKYYAMELSRMSALEQIKRMINSAVGSCDDLSADPAEIANALAARLETVNVRQTRLWELSGDVAERVYTNHRELAQDPERDRLGIPTGYMTLDEMTGGYFPGQLWMIAARSYMGKSAVALSMGQKLAARGSSVYFASYEMSNDELMERMYADRAVIPLSSFTKGRLHSAELQKVLCESQEIAAMDLLMDDAPPDSVNGIRARVKLAGSSRKVDLVIVDHLLLVPYRDRRVPRHQQLIEITRDLKRLAKDCECTVLLLSQLNADADGKEPNDTHYSESKAILQNLDVSILLHREDKKSEEMLFKVTKNRKGAPGEFRMKFLGEYQRVEDYPMEEVWTGM